jgi:hypothetical protein
MIIPGHLVLAIERRGRPFETRESRTARRYDRPLTTRTMQRWPAVSAYEEINARILIFSDWRMRCCKRHANGSWPPKIGLRPVKLKIS